jgi:hypothetical protein
MRKKYAVMSTLAAGSLAVTGVGVGTSVAASSAPTSHTLTFKSKQVSSKRLKSAVINVDKDVKAGKYIGNDVVRFTFTKKNSAKATVAAAFKGGLIYASFNSTQNGTISAGKVTGGTGQFKNATGTITGHSTKSGDEKVTITYQ